MEIFREINLQEVWLSMAGCGETIDVGFSVGVPVVVDFGGERISTDGGVLLLRQLDSRLGISRTLAALLPDARDPRRVTHTREEQVRQRLFLIAQGYEDQNDATALRQDPAFKLACDRDPSDPGGLSSQPSLSRLENAVDEETLTRLEASFEESYVAGLPNDTQVVVLDEDSFCDPAHGEQEQLSFNAYYDTWMYHPLVIFDQHGQLVTVRLRPGKSKAAEGAPALLERIIRLLKARFPQVQIVVRGDSAFSTPDMMNLLEVLSAELGDIEYLLGFGKNKVLLAKIAPSMAQARSWHEQSHKPVQLFTEVTDYAAGTWPHPRLVIAKAEHLDKGPNPRFVVTSLRGFPPSLIYQNAYCGRGQSENYIKDLKNALSADRLSNHTFTANAFRLCLHGYAYRLMYALRCEVDTVQREEPAPVALLDTAPAPLPATPAPPSLPPVHGRSQFDTLRLRLLKVAALVRSSTRRILVRLPESFPLASLLSALFTRLAVAQVDSS